MPTALMRLKLNLDEATAADLRAAAVAVNRGCNAAVRHWVRWHEDRPDWKPTQKITKKGVSKIKADGSPELESAMAPLELVREMYGVVRSQSKSVSAMIASSANSKLQEILRAKMPYDHAGEAKYKWQGILSYEISQPSFKAIAVPIHNRILKLTATDAGWFANIQLWSKESGRKEKTVALPIASAGMPAGLKRKLVKIASRSEGFAHCDSLLVEKEERGKTVWYLHLVYRMPQSKQLNVEREATLWAGPPDWNHMFALELSDGTIRRFGQTKPYEAEYRRLLIRRKSIQFRHRDGAGKGKGRGKWLGKIKGIGRAMRDLNDRVRKLAVADLMRILEQENIGTVVWREPSMGLRPQLSVAQLGLPWDWTSFGGAIAFKLSHVGGKLLNGPKYRCMTKEHREKFAWGTKPEAVEV